MDTSIVIFTKVPIPGLVKTRLTHNTCLTNYDSAKIAEAMLKDTVCLASKTKADAIQIGYFPKEKLTTLTNILNHITQNCNVNQEIELIFQNGTNFDQRFGYIVKRCFEKGIKQIVILGADLPFLDPRIIDSAFNLLGEHINKNPVILGPSNGGGIYLVGITPAFQSQWFSEYNLFTKGPELINFANLRKSKGFFLNTFPPYGDIDIEEDLVSLISYIGFLEHSDNNKGFYFPHYTAAIIEELGIYINEEQNKTRRRRISKRER
ncbi:MAG: DUF2064 domain-containing protein [Candidatus Lokiarchaeota archaeon]|nr:DUF2064 domain-containing protein [Candidatus Lokiarchaeota archaeon]MBD3201906.1 DUF2064 domain-containing protein [Candidatus Lokiarchaeota archaeon]